MKWRRAVLADVDAIEAIAGVIHVQLPESHDVIAEKVRLFPEGCFVLEDAGQIVGYCLSHPWHVGSPPALNKQLGQLPERPDCIFIHDIAVLAHARGRGAGGELLSRLLAIARQMNIPTLALVSVYDTYPFWQRFGFEVTEDATIADKLIAYGESARYMTRRAD